MVRLERGPGKTIDAEAGGQIVHQRIKINVFEALAGVVRAVAAATLSPADHVPVGRSETGARIRGCVHEAFQQPRAQTVMASEIVRDAPGAPPEDVRGEFEQRSAGRIRKRVRIITRGDWAVRWSSVQPSHSSRAARLKNTKQLAQTTGKREGQASSRQDSWRVLRPERRRDPHERTACAKWHVRRGYERRHRRAYPPCHSPK